jgi:alkylation response protein AidB-like acyl-CoA dehydrogenase
MVAIAYERKHAQWSRLHQVAKTILWGPSSALVSAPIAMTDGAAMLIESSGLTEELPQLGKAFARLTTRDPTNFWTSGQWMTERRGGSDVGLGTDTVAVPQADGSYRLYGYKWFTSATDADISFALARVQDPQGLVPPGSRGLSLFYLETRLGGGAHNSLELVRLKDKLGTRQLPTAEVLLDGSTAHLVGTEGRGVATISPMLTVTRLHNSIISAAYMRRILQLSRDYSTRRTVVGKYLAEQPLHMHTLAQMEVETRGCTLLGLETARLVGLKEAGLATISDTLLLRILNSINKLYTAKQAVAVISEGLESFGGAGYLEDTGLPVLLRDAQAGTIWEGTTNVLSLDLLRVLQKVGPEILEVVTDTVKSRLSRLPLARCQLESEADLIRERMQGVVTFVLRAMGEEPQCLEVAARDLALSLAHVYISMLLVEQACSDRASPSDRVTAERWCSRSLQLSPLTSYTKSQTAADLSMVMDGHRLSHSIQPQHSL